MQTFYVQARQPNVVFGAWRPSEVYFPSGGLRIDAFGSVRAPIFLDTGMVYSVVSQVPQASPALLRSLPGEWTQDVLETYTQLPASFSPRVRSLAQQITSDARSPYEAVVAVQRWLRMNTEYNLEVPAEPPGADPVERFLFGSRQGYCEHIATSMAVLLRAVGVPTRLVTGFATTVGPNGEVEVRRADAHAWIEILDPAVGWVPFDATPAGAPRVAHARRPVLRIGEGWRRTVLAWSHEDQVAVAHHAGEVFGTVVRFAAAPRG